VFGVARRRAVTVLDDVVEAFGRAGYRVASRPDGLSARLEGPPGGRPLVVRLVQQGRIFGGTYGLEVATADPILPPTSGLTARGRGLVRTTGVSFRARRGDEAGQALAARLEGDSRLRERLAAVHFERLRVEPDGRPLIRHMGGSLVWVLFPPLVKGVPLVDEQVRAVVGALDAFAAAGS
jgi:hypothetical protein